jgi:hypothetical protein
MDELVYNKLKLSNPLVWLFDALKKKKNREKIEETYVLHSRGILINYITALKKNSQEFKSSNKHFYQTFLGIKFPL